MDKKYRTVEKLGLVRIARLVEGANVRCAGFKTVDVIDAINDHEDNTYRHHPDIPAALKRSRQRNA